MEQLVVNMITTDCHTKQVNVNENYSCIAIRAEGLKVLKCMSTQHCHADYDLKKSSSYCYISPPDIFCQYHHHISRFPKAVICLKVRTCGNGGGGILIFLKLLIPVTTKPQQKKES